ncbi:MAG: hypothetical protein D8M58_21210 [Calditrichaeota bacterium]|nr:MAG: hypothetical protein DWQ03_16925 [Calditrichota bacterium]MBL1207932.1 hypothetical protein [Calditrichota bacterium]NOG47767.1 hypothetical protein [Calditrichota bacterium]
MAFPIIQANYNFECTMCGNCCTGDQKVNLNLFDLYKMALYEKYENTRQLFDNETVYLVKTQNDAWQPQIKFRALPSNKFNKKSIKFCPFLINDLNDQNNLKGLCCLHPQKKPLICSMAPVGRVLDLKDDSEKFVFVKPAPDCPGVESKKIHYLDDIKNNLTAELEYEKRFFKILDSLKKDHQKAFYLQELYSFKATENFEKILTILEQKFAQ